MADNPTYPPTGLDIAANEVSGALYQIIKMAYGASGSVTQVDATNPLPVEARIADISSTTDSSLDANSTSTVGTAINLTNAHRVALQVDGVTGTHATHVVTLQVSADSTNWHNTSTTITGEGVAQAEVFHKYARAAVTTAEGGASVVNITIQTK